MKKKALWAVSARLFSKLVGKRGSVVGPPCDEGISAFRIVGPRPGRNGGEKAIAKLKSSLIGQRIKVDRDDGEKETWETVDVMIESLALVSYIDMP